MAVDFSPCSRKALKWAMDNLLRKGDHLILITVGHEGEYESGEVQLWEDTGSPLIPFCDFSNPHTMKKYGVMPDAETLELVNIATKENGVLPILKIYWGDPREKICEAVDNIPLSCLVIGNRGLGKIKRVFLGSVSNHVVNNASCPVTVVH